MAVRQSMFRAITASVCVMLLAGGAFAQAGRNLEAERRLEFARQMLTTGMPRSAVAYYREFIDEFPSHPGIAEARFGLAKSLEMVGDAESADAYRNFLKLHAGDPKVAAARLGLAKSLYAAGQFADARSAFREFIIKHPADPSIQLASYYEAQCLLKTGRPADAVSIFKLVSEAAEMPLKAEAAYMAAAALWQAGQPESAAAALSAVSNRFPESEFSAKSDALTGDILFQQKSYQQAIRFYNRALDAKAQLSYSDEIRFWKSWAMVKSGETIAGANELQRLASLHPSSVRRIESLKHAASLYLSMDRKESAAAAWSELAASASGDTDLYEAQYEIGLLSFESGDDDKAKAAFVSAAREGSFLRAEAEYMLGQIALRSGNYSEADAFLSAAEQHTLDADLKDRILVMRLDVLKASGNAAAYQDILKKLEAARSPALAGAIRGQGELFESQGDFNAALREYTKVVQNFPGTPDAAEAVFRRGLLYYQMSKYDNAETDLARFVELKRNDASNILMDDAWYWIGFSRYQRNMWERSIEAFRKCAASGDGDKKLPALLRAGNAAFSMKNFEEAVNFFNDVIQNSSDPALSLDALFNKAESTRNLGMAAEAREIYLETWRRGGAEYEQALYKAAAMLEELGKTSDAAAAFADAAANIVNPSLQEESLMKAALLHRRAGAPQDALLIFESVAARGGVSTPEALLRIGEMKMESGDRAAAETYLKRAANEFQSSLFGRKASLLLAANFLDTAAAMAEYERILRNTSDDPAAGEAKLRIGLIHKAHGRSDSAIAALKDALSLLSDKQLLLEARLALGELLFAARKYSQARVQVEFIYRSPLYADHPSRGAAGILLAKSLIGLNQIRDALNILTEVADKHPEVSDEAKRLIEEARSKR